MEYKKREMNHSFHPKGFFFLFFLFFFCSLNFASCLPTLGTRQKLPTPSFWDSAKQGSNKTCACPWVWFKGGFIASLKTNISTLCKARQQQKLCLSIGVVQRWFRAGLKDKHPRPFGTRTSILQGMVFTVQCVMGLSEFTRQF